MPDSTFETLFTGQLRKYAEAGVRPIDRFAIAEETIAGGRTMPRWRLAPIRGNRVLILLLVGLLLAAGLVAVGAQHEMRLAVNGWVAFARGGSGPEGPNGWVERDIYLVREGETAHRVVGSDAETLDQICPAISPDGQRLAHGEAEGTVDTAYRGAALVISDLDAAGNASESMRIDVGGAFPPPCAVWSADGRRVAFGVPLTSPRNPVQSATGSAVWVASVSDGHVDVLPDLLATDLEWSPDGSTLAIASGQANLVHGESLRDGTLLLYDADSADMRTLVGPSGVDSLTWSPDGSRIAYQRGSSDGGGMDQELWVARVDGSGEDRLTRRGFGAIRGVGPVWSPAGDRIVYQRMKGAGTESHDVVLMTLDDGREVVLPDLRVPGDPGVSGPWRPSGVIWSPDGSELLYTAWISGRPGRALISVPIDPGLLPAVLAEDVTDFDQDRALPIQSWGRRPDG
jgi:dipeptidyl aminopeptidase/acylaminoacyl peptidase